MSFRAIPSTLGSVDPGALALSQGERTLTYGELLLRSTWLAERLRAFGIERGTSVALCLPRSIEAVVAALAAMQTGAAYLPLDPTYPAERLRFQLADSGAELMVIDHRAAPAALERLRTAVRTVVDVSACQSPPPAIQSSAMRSEIEPDDLAYIIYTSGSTGRPKGVEITHSGLANLVAWHGRAFQIRPRDRASHLSPVSFDAAVWEIWPYLAAGASVHIVDDATAKDSDALLAWLVEQRVTVSFVPTPLAERLLKASWPATTALRFMLTGADTLHAYPPPSLPFALVNNYGPTECCVVATSGVVGAQHEPGTLPSIGTAIDGAAVYVVDEYGRLADEGEIWIGGAGVGHGYRNLPELTAQAFVPDPFARTDGERLYRTGDRGRRLPDGRIAFLGRIDDQIKLRGIRIEPAEIERALNEHPSVSESAVVARELDGDVHLVANVVFRTAPPAPAALRGFLAERLPAFMLPSRFAALPALPLSEHGKIDRRELRSREPMGMLRDDTVRVEPRTPTESRLRAILEELMKFRGIGLDENFFTLGGHSLLATQLIARLRDAFGVSLSLRFLFEHPTIAEMAAEVDRLAEAGEVPTLPLVRRA